MKYLSNLALLGLSIPVATFLTTGCRSVSSTIMDRTPSDNLVSESNGERCHFDQGAPYRGIPVVVKVPSHVDVEITEELLFTELGDVPTNKELVQLRPSKRKIGVNATVCQSDKLFFVDFKRPAGGTLDYTINYGDGEKQYFKSIKYKAVDETISDINGALVTVVGGTAASPMSSLSSPVGKEKPADNKTVENKPKVALVPRTIAWKRFDINEPDFEQQLVQFVNFHLNDCNECGPTTTCPAVQVVAEQ